MRKTLLISLDFWPNIGGVADYYYNLSKNFPKNSIVVLSSEEKPFDFDFKVYNKKLLYDRFWLKWLKALFETIKIIKKEGIEVLWVGNILPLGIVAFIIKKIFRIPYFVSLHGYDIALAKRNFWKKYITKIILDNAEFIAPNSELTKTYLSGFTKNQNIEIIYPGVSQEFLEINDDIRKEIINKYNLENKKIILSVARLVERKNQKLIIEAAKVLKEKMEDFVCVIMGSGENLENLQELVKTYSLEKYVLFLNGEENRDIRQYFFSLSDVFVMVSLNSGKDIEGFGIVYLEAGIFKKVAIGAKNGGKEAIIDNETGFLINNNTEELVSMILNVFKDEEMAKRIGDNAYKRIVNNFLWKDIAKKLMNIIK